MKKIMYIGIVILVSSFTFPVGKTQAFTAMQPTPDWVENAGARQMPRGKKIFKVNQYGAVNDGKTMDTKFIQEAIDDCAAKGGGIVMFDPGEYVTGSVFLKSGVTLRIDKGVKISGSGDINDYPVIDTRVAGIEMKWPAGLINVINQKNVAITGEGIIDGRGKPFWDSYRDMRKVYDPKGLRWAADYDCRRPRLLLISGSSDVTLSGLHLQRSGFWTVHILYSSYITVNGVTIENNIGGHGPSTDGIDIDSSVYILVEGCDIDCNDDNYCLKAGRDADGLRVNRPTEYVVIRDCIARGGSGLCTLGSETSGGIWHVLVENSKAVNTSNAVRIKSALTRGGIVEDIHIRGLKVQHASTAIKLNLNWAPSYSYTALPKGYDRDSIPPYWRILLERVPPSKGIPAVRDVYISDIDAKGCNTAIDVVGLKTSPAENFKLTNIRIAAHTAGKIRYAKNWYCDKVMLQTKDNSKVKMADVVNVKL